MIGKIIISIFLFLYATLPTVYVFAAQTFATFNPSDKESSVVLTNGNLSIAPGNCGLGQSGAKTTISVSSGKWYYEFKLTSVSNDGMVGFANSSESNSAYPGIDNNGWGIYMATGNKLHTTNTGYGSSFVINDIAMVALDLDNGKIYWGKNGTWFNSGDPAAGTNPAFTSVSGTLFGMAAGSCIWTGTANFGASAFTYSVPSGFSAGIFTGTATPAQLGFFLFFKRR